jgi:type IV pilus assembly protein PilB
MVAPGPSVVLALKMAYAMHKLATLQHDDQSIIDYVNQLIQHALSKQASDIHLEPYQNETRVRFRCDGLLHHITNIPTHLALRVMTRLKIMANLNIAERRLPQDGRMSPTFANQIHLRINTCPTLFGEKIVLRILDATQCQLNLDALGLSETQLAQLKNALLQPQGLILVTGPTGSGKTVTLYSALQHINHPEKNILTAEEPIEMALANINQVAIHPQIGLDFATVLRAFLRQDPDIIMVGEIRDSETARLALLAAQTGHLVLSTMHTNSAAETMTRLQAMGIPNYLLTSSISLIIAQRLVRKVHGQQLKGRTGIFELLSMSPTISRLILAGGSTLDLLRQMKKENMALLIDSGQHKITLGITNQAELTRVLGT